MKNFEPLAKITFNFALRANINSPKVILTRRQPILLAAGNINLTNPVMIIPFIKFGDVFSHTADATLTRLV